LMCLKKMEEVEGWEEVKKISISYYEYKHIYSARGHV
jgi:hypothetical protein